MKTLAYMMTQFDSRIDYQKAVSFLARRSEHGDKTYFSDMSFQSNVSIMVELYWWES